MAFDLGTRIVELRGARGLSQEALARADARDHRDAAGAAEVGCDVVLAGGHRVVVLPVGGQVDAVAVRLDLRTGEEEPADDACRPERENRPQDDQEDVGLLLGLLLRHG